MAVLGMAFPGTLAAHEPTVPIETLLQKFDPGPVEEAREELRLHMERELTELEGFIGRPSFRDLDLFYSISSSTWVAEQLERWEAAEIHHQRQGGEAPDAVKVELMEFPLRVETVLRRLEARLQSDGPGRVHPDDFELVLRNAHRKIGRLLLKTAIFAEGSASVEEREELLNLARRLTDAPETLRQLEGQVEILFPPFQESSGPGSMTAGAPSPVLEVTPEVRDLIERFYRTFYKGDLATVQRLLTPETASKVNLQAKREEIRGEAFLGYGKLEVRETPGANRAELRVWIVDLRLLDASGQEVRTRNELVLERIGDRYRIKKF